MMVNPQNEYYLSDLRRKEMMNQAEKERLISQAARMQPAARLHYYQALLAWLGSVLTRWGTTLQERYGPTMNAELPAFQTEPSTPCPPSIAC